MPEWDEDNGGWWFTREEIMEHEEDEVTEVMEWFMVQASSDDGKTWVHIKHWPAGYGGEKMLVTDNLAEARGMAKAWGNIDYPGYVVPMLRIVKVTLPVEVVE